MIRKIKIFLEMIKFEHSLFALPFAYLGMILSARGWPGWEKFFWITFAMVSFRTMAMAANRLVDERIDALNPRTANRALPAGLLKRPFVWGAAFFSFVLFQLACWKLGPLCLQLSIIPFLLAWIYPYLKRSTVFCHFLLGLVLGIAPYGAWLGVKAEFSWIPGFLTLGILCWVAGFDIIYALLDLDFDREKGVYSVPAKWGAAKAKVIAQILHALALIFWIAAGFSAQLTWIYFLGLFVAGALMFREHFLIASHQDAARINEAFFTLNAWISVIIFAAVAIDLGGWLR